MWSGDAINTQYYLPDERPGRRPALLVPRGRQGRRRQRPGRLPGAGREPGRRARLHQRPARRGHRRDELRLHRLPAAADRVHPGDPGRERVRAAEPGRVPSSPSRTSRPGCRCSSCRSSPTSSTTRSGRSSRPVADRAGPTGERLPLAAAGAARHRLARACSSWRRCTSCWRSSSAESTRSCASRCRSGTRTLELRAVPVRARAHRRGGRVLPARAGAHRRRTSAIASVLCLVIAYPVAYYTARFAGRWKGVLLAALIAPFWISYMMRMLAWVNLLQTDGLVNKRSAWAASSTSTSTGWTGDRRRWSSAWSTATCRT